MITPTDRSVNFMPSGTRYQRESTSSGKNSSGIQSPAAVSFAMTYCDFDGSGNRLWISCFLTMVLPAVVLFSVSCSRANFTIAELMLPFSSRKMRKRSWTLFFMAFAMSPRCCLFEAHAR